MLHQVTPCSERAISKSVELAANPAAGICSPTMSGPTTARSEEGTLQAHGAAPSFTPPRFRLRCSNTLQESWSEWNYLSAM